MSTPNAKEPRPALMWLLALLPVLAAYANVSSVGFMWDDHMLIVQNDDLHELHPPWEYLARSFWQHPFLYGQVAYYRPLINFSFAVDWALSSGGPVLFHLTNLALHLAVCTLVFGFVIRRSQSAMTAAMVTMLFGVMPRLTESVTWVVGRTDVMATMWVLLGLWAAGSGRARVRPLAGALLLLGLLAKEVALLGVAALMAELVLDVLRRRRSAREQWPLAASVALGLVVWWTLRSNAQSAARLQLHDVKTFLAGMGHYTSMVLVPWQPVAQIGFVREPEGWAMALGLISLVAAAGVCLQWVRGAEPVRGVWLASAVGGVVLVSLVALPVYTIASDRFLYLPLAFGAVVAGHTAWRRWVLFGGLGATVALSIVTWQHNELWGDPLRFWQEAHQRAAPGNPGVSAGLGDALVELARFEEARALYLEAEARRGPQRYSPSKLSLVSVESKLGHDAEALALLEVVIADNPGWRRAAFDEVLFRARALDFPGARAALVRTRARFGDDDVLHEFERLMRVHENAATAGTPLERARALHALGATRKAQVFYEQCLAQPDARLEASQWLLLLGSERGARRGLEALGDGPEARAVWNERFPPPRELRPSPRTRRVRRPAVQVPRRLRPGPHEGKPG